MIRRFRGESVHKVDQKGRVSVPAPFRRVCRRAIPTATGPATRTFVPDLRPAWRGCLEGYSMRASASSTMVSRCPASARTARRWSAASTPSRSLRQVDENGRIVLPQRLREQFGPPTRLYFAGMGDQFQVWAPKASPPTGRAPRTWRRRAAEATLLGRLDGEDARRSVMMMAPVPHVPVLLAPILRAVAPVKGTWLDGTFGAGGYARRCSTPAPRG